MPSVVPYESKYRIQIPIYPKEIYDNLLISKLKENLRMRLFMDIGKLLGKFSTVEQYKQTHRSYI